MSRFLPDTLVYSFFILIFALQTISRDPACIPDYFDKVKCTYVVGHICEEPVYSAKRVRFIAELKAGIRPGAVRRLCGRLLVSLPRNGRTYGVGDKIVLPLVYKKPSPAFNPYQFDYGRYLRNRHVYYETFYDANEVMTLSRASAFDLRSIAANLRLKMVRRFDEYIPDKEAAAIAATLILGYKNSVDPNILDAYSKSGVFHVLSVSGMHVALVVQILSALLFFMSRTKTGRICRSILLVTAVWFYVLLTGLSVAACRSAIMITAVIIPKLWNGESNTANSVAAAAVILLAYDPYYLLDAGFQLSFLAVFGIVYIDPLLQKFNRSSSYFFRAVVNCITISIAAQIATFPLVLYYFNQFSLYFLIANLFVMVPVLVIMAAGIAFVLFPVPFLSHMLASVLGGTIHFVNGGLLAIAHLPSASLHTLQFGVWFYLSGYVLLILLFMAVSTRSGRPLLLSVGIGLGLTAYKGYKMMEVAKSDSIVFYSLPKGMAVGFRKGGSIRIVSTVPETSRFCRYSIMPLVLAKDLRLMSYSFPGKQKGDKPFALTCIFRGKKTVIWDHYRLFPISKRMAVHYLVLPASLATELTRRRKMVNVRNVIFYNSASKPGIEAALRRLRQDGITVHCVGGAPAVEVVLP